MSSAERPELRAVLATNVRRLRLAVGLSQEAFGEACGLDRTYISAVERRIWNVSLDNIVKLAKALRVEPWQLIKPHEAA